VGVQGDSVWCNAWGSAWGSGVVFAGWVRDWERVRGWARWGWWGCVLAGGLGGSVGCGRLSNEAVLFWAVFCRECGAGVL